MSTIEALDWSAQLAKREAYCLALGRFIDQFSSVEAAMQVTLWHFAKIPPSTGRALLHGARIDAAIKLINRLADTERWPSATVAKFRDLFDHLHAINSLRNDIVHFGALPSSTEQLLVTNSLMAIAPDRIKTTHISGTLLDDMTHDLRRELVEDRAAHLGDDDHQLVETEGEICRGQHVPALGLAFRADYAAGGRSPAPDPAARQQVHDPRLA
jgi:hypothetical protein